MIQMMTRRRRSPAAGFTLTELMIVVAILAILSSLAIVHLKSRTKPIDVASRFAQLVAEASRVAVRGGPVRDDVALAGGSKRRTRIVGSVNGETVAFTLEVLVEQAGTTDPTWAYVGGMTMPAKVEAFDYAMAVGNHASITPSTDWTQFELACFPNGSCAASSLFFAASDGPTQDRHARISVLPLGTATYVKNDWN
jgi:prepilin-type N-terminal cleavage/methylation domain-containing protein